MRASRLSAVAAVIVLTVVVVVLVNRRPDEDAGAAGPTAPVESAAVPMPAAKRLPGEILMQAYGDPATDPADDLRALERVLTGYFSIVKDHRRYPIGGNEDLAAALRGENANRQAFLPPEHPAFDSSGRLVDRWGTPVFVHPLAAREIEFRSAGPDRKLFTEDDIALRGE